MPIYEYQCRDCGHIFDVLQKLADEPLKFCPDCGKPELKKLLSAPSFHLKGSGWYKTDFRDKPKPGAETKPAGSAAADPATSEPRKDPTPDSASGQDRGQSRDQGHSHDHGHSHSHGSGQGHSHD